MPNAALLETDVDVVSGANGKSTQDRRVKVSSGGDYELDIFKLKGHHVLKYCVLVLVVLMKFLLFMKSVIKEIETLERLIH